MQLISLIFIFSFYSLWDLFVDLLLVPLIVKLGCLFEVFLVFLRWPGMLWIFLLGLLSLCPIDFRFCSHFLLFQDIVWVLLFWSYCQPIHCLVTYSLFVFVFFSFFSCDFDVQFRTIMVRWDAWYGFNLLKFIETCFVSYHAVYPR